MHTMIFSKNIDKVSFNFSSFQILLPEAHGYNQNSTNQDYQSFKDRKKTSRMGKTYYQTSKLVINTGRVEYNSEAEPQKTKMMNWKISTMKDQ